MEEKVRGNGLVEGLGHSLGRKAPRIVVNREGAHFAVMGMTGRALE